MEEKGVEREREKGSGRGRWSGREGEEKKEMEQEGEARMGLRDGKEEEWTNFVIGYWAGQ